MISFTVHGTPRPKGSLRHVGKGRMIEQTDVKRWMGVVRNAIARQGPYERMDGVPCEAILAFRFERPKSAQNRLYPHVRSTGDLDKLVRAVLDAMQPQDDWLGIISDDSQVVRISASKEYGPTPGVTVELRELS